MRATQLPLRDEEAAKELKGDIKRGQGAPG